MRISATKTTYEAATYFPASSSGNAGTVPQSLQLHRRVLGRQLELPERHEQQRDPDERHEEGQAHLAGQASARLGEHARVRVFLGEPSRDEVEGHERAGRDGEDRRVA